MSGYLSINYRMVIDMEYFIALCLGIIVGGLTFKFSLAYTKLWQIILIVILAVYFVLLWLIDMPSNSLLLIGVFYASLAVIWSVRRKFEAKI